MCGIAGFVSASAMYGEMEESLGLIRRMVAKLSHRGPDGSGAWVDKVTGTVLGHSRLAILDLTNAGKQPMLSISGRYVLTFNGEIYNHNEIRAAILHERPSHPFLGHSDTEVMLAAFELWGVDSAISQFNGMFAFVVLDREEHLLHLARDRIGEKPLFFGIHNNVLLFGSELKALSAHPAWKFELDTRAIEQFLRYGYVPAPLCIVRDIEKLEPACLATFDVSTASPRLTRQRKYWSLEAVVREGIERPLDMDQESIIDGLEGLLVDAVKLRMEADVPLGAFLSGGVDSSTVVALMQSQSIRPIRTYSIGFWEPSYNEAQHAKTVARHLGTDHTELYVTPSEALDVIPRLPSIYDEPFADSSQIPTFLVASLARSGVKVALSGDGGDELFGGYPRYLTAEAMWSKLGMVPGCIRRAGALAIRSVSPAVWDRIGRHVPSKWTQGRLAERAQRASNAIGSAGFDAFYDGLMAIWSEPTRLLCEDRRRGQERRPSRWSHQLPAVTDRMMSSDLGMYLPDDILTKVDRATMAVSLEGRMPLLDHRVIEYAWRMPQTMKVHHRTVKFPLRAILDRHVPKELIDRPKQGFGIPVAEWLRNELTQWAHDLLDPALLGRQGLFDAAFLNQCLNEHVSGQRNLAYQLWVVLMLQAWLQSPLADLSP